MERYGADWTYDTLVRCRKFYQAYANASIVAMPLPQLENPTKTADSMQVSNWGNGIAPMLMEKSKKPSQSASQVQIFLSLPEKREIYLHISEKSCTFASAIRFFL